jgi:hypothetical protein
LFAELVSYINGGVTVKVDLPVGDDPIGAANRWGILVK